MRNSKPILLVEDDEIDKLTVERALRQLQIANPLFWAAHGEAALDLLRGDDPVRPCLILLDLKMPRMGGLELLGILKADEFLKRIPVVVLTSSREEYDRNQSFGHSVAGYMVKPVDYTQFVEVVRTINLYWTLSEGPGGGS